MRPKRRSPRHPETFGTGLIEGVVCPEAATHSSVQGDFIPTMSLGIPGDAVMALLLGALMIQGIVPGPQLISQHPDIFWGLVASFWIGNIMLVLLNVPLIGIWVKMLAIPYKFLYPSAMFFVCIGVYAANNDFFQVGEVVVIGAFGYLLLRLGFHPAPILLGFVLGPRFEENFRRAMLISRGDLGVFVERPISAVFVAMCVILIGSQIYFRLRGVEAADRAVAAAARRRHTADFAADRAAARCRTAGRIIGVARSGAIPRVTQASRAARGRARAPAGRKTAARRPGVRRRARRASSNNRCAASSLKRAIAVAERRERDHQLVARIDFEDRLRRRGEPPGAGKNLFQRAVRPGIRRDQTDRAVGEPVRGPHVGDRFAQRRLHEDEEIA